MRRPPNDFNRAIPTCSTTVGQSQHVRDYKTVTNLGPDENAQEPESVTFETSVVPGTPPVLRSAAGESSVQPKRIKGLFDPGKDPLLKAGDVPIAFK